MMAKKIIAYTLVFLLLGGCNLPLYDYAPPTPNAISQVNISLVSQNLPPTATPFQPIPPTATSSETETPFPTNTPTPDPASIATIVQKTAGPTPTPWFKDIPLPSGQVKILIMGTDFRPNLGGFRTDVMVLLVINASQGTASAVSFPRDLYVTIPGVGENRLNTAMAYGGFGLMSATFEVNFGIRPDYYIFTNFDGFINIVDDIGGVDIELTQALADKCDLPIADFQGYCYFPPGKHNFDGPTALWFVRSRHTTSDFDRTHRVQEILKGIFKKMLSWDTVTYAPVYYELYRSNVETNLSLEIILSLILVVPQIAEPGNIRQYFIGPSEVSSYTVPETGAMVLLPNPGAIQSIIYQAIYNP